LVVDLVQDADVAAPALDSLGQSLQGDVRLVGVELEGLQDVLGGRNHEVLQRLLDLADVQALFALDALGLAVETWGQLRLPKILSMPSLLSLSLLIKERIWDSMKVGEMIFSVVKTLIGR
jgi:hypothetical protein